MTGLPRTLFVGRGKGATTWYRCALPATVLGQTWLGLVGDPDEAVALTGTPGEQVGRVQLDGYDVVVLQVVKGNAWLRRIERWQAAGVKVLYEIDDWLRGIRKLSGHDFASQFGREEVAEYERCMAACDGVICSTEWLARRYRSVNPVTYVCRNGIDLKRYALTRPSRDHVAIGWAGATGHAASAKPWVLAVGELMRGRPEARFVSVGQPFADWLVPEHGRERCLSIPWSPLDTYPAAMTHLDVALAPAGRGSFFRGKSDLRWLEASALGIPLVADPEVYPEIEHGVTGFHASTPAEMLGLLTELVRDASLRERVGAAARDHVREHRTIQVAAQAWAEVLREVAGLQAPRAAAAV